MAQALAAERQTARLVLRPWSEADVRDFATLCSDPAAMHFITGGRPIPRDHIHEIAERTLRMWDEHGFGPWAAIERTTGRWVGRIGLNLLHDWPQPDKWEIGFELSPPFWGQGLATEGAREGVRFAFEDVQLHRVISVTRFDHAASRRVMEKCGLAFQAEVDWRGTRVAWYAVDGADWDRSASP